MLGLNYRKPPYARNTDQMQDFPGTNHSQDFNQAVKNLQYMIQSIEVYYNSNAGKWVVDLNDGDGAQDITEGWYDPEFPVRCFALVADTEANYMPIIYDTPFSEKVIFSWATHITIPGQITRLWTGDNAMTQGKILLSR